MEISSISDLDLARERLDILQVNLGYRCNQACTHCHVNAGPNRTEEMSKATVDSVLDFIRKENIKYLDITGGAPELNPSFRYLVSEATMLGTQVVDRCNLTIITEKNFGGLPEFFAAKKVKIIASMPCYSKENVDSQRGKGIFEKSIQALERLNHVGYGVPSSGLILDLVYNPLGPNLPPDPKCLESEYRQEFRQLGVVFNNLLTMTNMPISRFEKGLLRKGQLQNYKNLLRQNFKRSNVDHVMCRSTLSVDWKGYVYDCDFNQMLGLPAGKIMGRRHLSQINGNDLIGEKIRIDEHCFGCFAGRGSSCGGALDNSND